jgi:RNA polymerase sigma-70 factor (ECF subfamily)
MTTAAPPESLAAAREQFLALVDGVRPDLHRYASRLVGSAIDGEDVVQDTLAKALYALSQSPEVPELRPWLFRIAHNTAIDFMRRYERRNVSVLPEEELMSDESPRDPVALRAALTSFVRLPTQQRSAVILKDVLDESLEDVAAHLETSVEAVKALLVRGRAKLHAEVRADAAPVPRPDGEHEQLARYVDLFNRRDWEGVHAMLVEDCRLDLVSKSQRKGKAVGMYFGRYAAETGNVYRLGRVEGRPAMGVFRGEPETLAYVVFVELQAGCVAYIRDFRYVPYMAREITFVADP